MITRGWSGIVEYERSDGTMARIRYWVKECIEAGDPRIFRDVGPN